MSAPVFQDKVTAIAENFLNTVSKTVYEGLGGKATPDEIVAWLGLTPGSGGTTTVIDDLLSHAVADALSANQGRILDGKITASEQTANKGVSSGYAPLDASAKVPVANLPDAMDTSHFATHQEVIDGDALQQTLDEKDQASGYVSLDANSKVPLQFLPASGTSNHMFANVAEMLVSGAHINQGDTALVHGDPDPTKDGQYVALKNHPDAIADWFKDDSVPMHRHRSNDVDVQGPSGATHTLAHELVGISVDLAHMLRTDGANPFVSISPAEVSALINDSLYLDERHRLMWKNASGLHEVLNFADVAANTAAIAANAGKIATNTAGVATATSDAAAAKSDAATALSAANTTSSELSAHVNKAANAHSMAAIAGLSAEVTKIATNTTKIATNTTGVTAAKSDAAAAKNLATTALSAANTTSSGLSAHINKASNAHPYTAITDVERVFTDRIKGVQKGGTTAVLAEQTNSIGTTAFYQVNVGTTTGQFPSGFSNYGLLAVIGLTSGGALQILYDRTDDNIGKSWIRKMTNYGTAQPWQVLSDGYHHVQLTQAAYTALTTKDPKTIYLIVG